MKDIKEPWDLMKVPAFGRKINVNCRSNHLPKVVQQMKDEFNETLMPWWNKWVLKKEAVNISPGKKKKNIFQRLLKK